MKNFKIGIFSTFRDREALNLFNAMHQACKNGFIRGEISFVFCNREKGDYPNTDEYLSSVEKSGIPLVCFSSKKFKPEERRGALGDPDLIEKWRVEYDRAGPERAARKYQPDLIVLAGYMLILGEEMCKNWVMINLHPALPWGPKGSWEEVVWDLMRTGERETGAMIHLVTKDLDRGPPISFYKISLEDLNPLWIGWERKLRDRNFLDIKKAEYRTNRLFRAIREKQLPGEVPLILLTLKYISEGVIQIKKVNGKRKVFVRGKPCEHGMRLDEEINSLL